MNADEVAELLIDRLAERTGGGQPLDGVTVLDGWREPEVTARTIYGGGAVFDRPGDNDVYDGTETLANEVGTIRLYVRVAGDGSSLRETRAAAWSIAAVVAAAIAKDPSLAGPNTEVRYAGGSSDYEHSDAGPVVVLAIRIQYSIYVN